MKEKDLGKYLKSIREASGFTLRAVEEMAGVSNAFLSQLESGKVKQPSPTVLYKLAMTYGVPYETMMEHAGYPVPGAPHINKPAFGAFHRLGALTEEEEVSLLEYLTFLRSRSGKKRSAR